MMFVEVAYRFQRTRNGFENFDLPRNGLNSPRECWLRDILAQRFADDTALHAAI